MQKSLSKICNHPFFSALFYGLFLFGSASVATIQNKKIIGLVQIRNEANVIEQCLKALAMYTDSIIVLDDGSHDSTVAICQSLAPVCNIEEIICNTESAWQRGVESENRQKLLDAGRAHGGTHFMFVDADEMFTSNCSKNNYLRNEVLKLQPGDQLVMCWIQLWRSVKNYRFDGSVWTWNYKRVIFCDDGTSCYDRSFLHGPQCPQGLAGKVYKIEGYEYGLMHFQFVNWRNLLIKQAWYRCLEHITYPTRSIVEINEKYGLSKNEHGLRLKSCPAEWFDSYSNFDSRVYDKPELWREKHVLEWFDQYGKSFFSQLDIWDVDWGKGL